MPETSMFGFQSANPVDRAAYDMMVMQELGILDADIKEGELNADEGDKLLYTAVRRGW